jgi:hypothetical protein
VSPFRFHSTAFPANADSIIFSVATYLRVLDMATKRRNAPKSAGTTRLTRSVLASGDSGSPRMSSATNSGAAPRSGTRSMDAATSLLSCRSSPLLALNNNPSDQRTRQMDETRVPAAAASRHRVEWGQWSQSRRRGLNRSQARRER